MQGTAAQTYTQSGVRACNILCAAGASHVRAAAGRQSRGRARDAAAALPVQRQPPTSANRRTAPS